MASTMADLAEELVVEILSRVPMSSLGLVRGTCKKWNVLSKTRICDEAGAVKNQFLGFVVMGMGCNVFSLRFDLQGILNDGDDFIDLSFKQVDILNQIEVFKSYHCDGLLLCVLSDYSGLLIWNPYLGQMRWIQIVSDSLVRFDLGYDRNRNHKILKISKGKCDIYEFSSNSWRALDHVTLNWKLPAHKRGVTLNGNSYFYVQEKIISEGVTKFKDVLVCFDYTLERFGPCLSLPFHFSDNESESVTLCCVRDEKLAVVYQSLETSKMEIWVTSKVDYNEVLWTKFFEADVEQLGFPFNHYAGSFLIDEEKKFVLVFDIAVELDGNEPPEGVFYQTAYIIGQDGCKSINVRGAPHQRKPDMFSYYQLPLLCCSYVPSLVHIE